MWEPRPLTPLWAFTARYRDSFTFLHSHNSGLQAIRRYRYCHTFQFTVTFTLGFSDFTSRISATELQLSHCHFESHVKSSFHSLIPLLPLFCSCQFRRLDSIQFQAHFPAGWRPETQPFTLNYCSILGRIFRLCPFITPLHGPRGIQSLYSCRSLFPCCCLAIDVLLFPALARAGRCLPSRCLAMGLHVTILRHKLK
jgi:hypothetical protein